MHTITILRFFKYKIPTAACQLATFQVYLFSFLDFATIPLHQRSALLFDILVLNSPPLLKGIWGRFKKYILKLWLYYKASDSDLQYIGSLLEWINLLDFEIKIHPVTGHNVNGFLTEKFTFDEFMTLQPILTDTTQQAFNDYARRMYAGITDIELPSLLLFYYYTMKVIANECPALFPPATKLQVVRTEKIIDFWNDILIELAESGSRMQSEAKALAIDQLKVIDKRIRDAKARETDIKKARKQNG